MKFRTDLSLTDKQTAASEEIHSPTAWPNGVYQAHSRHDMFGALVEKRHLTCQSSLLVGKCEKNNKKKTNVAQFCTLLDTEPSLCVIPVIPLRLLK